MKVASSPQQVIKQNPQAALDRVLGFLRSRQLPQAASLCQQIVKAVPGFADAWLLLCQLQLDLQRPERAMQCVDRALALNADDPRATLLQVECLIASSRSTEARAILETVESRSRHNAPILRLAGNIYAGMHSYDDALRCFELSVQLDPEDVECWHLYSGVLFAQGLIEKAEQALNEVLRLNPLHCEALLTRASMRKQSFDNNHVPQLQELLETGHVDGPDAVMLAYALAKELDDLGEYSAAFAHLKRGADKKDSLLEYQPDRDVAFMEYVSDAYQKKLSGLKSDKSLGKGMVFVVSLPRAGSTLVDRILGSHTAVESLGETGAFHEALLQHARAASAVKKMTFTDALSHVDYTALGNTYLEKLGAYSSKAAMVIDKTPSNIQYLGLIHKALPQAKVVHVQKSPMDACYSIYKTYFSRGYGYSYDLQKLGHYYVAYHHMMAHWTRSLPGLFHEVNYEQLVANQKDQTRQLLEYCELGWEDHCLNFHLNSSPTATASVVQVRQPLFNSSVGKWRCYDRQLAPLAAILGSAGIETG
ncbi:MAG: sulfotransferase [Halioglobus sp.]